jgi:Family of unknown function (DUF6492)
MDLITVTWSGDLPAMRLQAHSLDRFVADPVVHHVYIEDTAMDLAAWHAQLVPFYSRHHLVLCDGHALLHSRLGDFATGGWQRQQAIKLLAARDVSSSRYMVLDSKNLAIKHIDISGWPVRHGSGVPRGDRRGEMERFIQDLVRDRGIDQPRETWTPCTPWIMHTEIAKICFDRGHVHYLVRHPLPYEFALYACVAEMEGAQLLVDHTDANVWIHWDRNLLNRSQLDLIHAMPTKLMMAIHRNALASKDPRVQILRTWLSELGLDAAIVQDYLGA